MKFIFQRLTAKYKSQVLELLNNYLWNWNDAELSEKYFNWKFEENPYLTDFPCFIALDNDKVVAFRGAFITPMKFGDEIFLSAQIGDMVTHPAYRRKKLFQNLTHYTINELKKDDRILTCCVSSSGGPTLGGYLNLDFKPLSEREHLYKISYFNLIKKIILNKTRTIKNCKTKNYEISFKCKLNDILSLNDKTDKITHLRDAKFYDWRFKNPKNKFIYSYLYNGNAIKSYIIFLDRGGNRYDIIDFNYINSDDLRFNLNKFFKVTDASFINIWTVNKNNVIYKNKKYFGFGLIHKILYKFKKFQKPPFLVKIINESTFTKLFEDSSNWDINKIIADEI